MILPLVDKLNTTMSSKILYAMSLLWAVGNGLPQAPPTPSIVVNNPKFELIKVSDLQQNHMFCPSISEQHEIYSFCYVVD